MTKFGKVFVEERKTCLDGKEVVVPTLLSDIRFSNTDHKWYDGDGSLSPAYEGYKGRPIFLQFKIDLIDKHGKAVNFEAKVILPFALGELKPQDFECVPSAEKEMKDYWKTVGMLSNDVDKETIHNLLRATEGARFVACLSQGSKISEMKTLHASVDPYFTLDEFNDQNYYDFKQTNLYATALSAVVAGNWEGQHNEKVVTDIANLPEKFSKLLLGIQGFRDAIAEKGEYAEHLVQSYEDFHDGMALETCREWKTIREDSTSVIFQAFHDELRIYSTGSITALEMVLFDRNVRVDRKVRNSFLFRRLVRSFAKHCTYVNDLMSIKKEMAAGDGPDNTIFISHAKKGFSLQEALQKNIDQIAWLTQVVNEAGELLINLYGEHLEAAQVVDAIKGIMYGNIQWCTASGRYLPNIVCDCVV